MSGTRRSWRYDRILSGVILLDLNRWLIIALIISIILLRCPKRLHYECACLVYLRVTGRFDDGLINIWSLIIALYNFICSSSGTFGVYFELGRRLVSYCSWFSGVLILFAAWRSLLILFLAKVALRSQFRQFLAFQTLLLRSDNPCILLLCFILVALINFTRVLTVPNSPGPRDSWLELSVF